MLVTRTSMEYGRLRIVEVVSGEQERSNPGIWIATVSQQFISSCGDIHNISFPFHVQGDPSYTCNNDDYTLSCDNNRTVLQLLFGNYYVKSINYTDESIRLVDVGIQTNNICSSFPLSSLTPSNLTFSIDFPFYWVESTSVSSVVFLSCEKPVQSPKYINRTAYCNTTRDDAGNGYYSYVMAGDVRVSDVADSCTVEVLYMSSSQLISERGSNLSWLDFNRELGYGFEAQWSFGGCHKCKERASCFGDSENVTAVCHFYCYTPASFLQNFFGKKSF
ncbi:hypothetical protein Vadar_029835 [Vaccinium darrowii]|uniref:Uncharacterized protein n=1 Tax=Vaccinium darrowii TaxID=229202 RepID=A0ACB7YQQ9_9ERIC|nr:hypothetical protein Vadar_029835 [Vaccinium darrowii]